MFFVPILLLKTCNILIITATVLSVSASKPSKSIKLNLLLNKVNRLITANYAVFCLRSFFNFCIHFDVPCASECSSTINLFPARILGRNNWT